MEHGQDHLLEKPENLYAIANGIGLGEAGTANVLLLINLCFRPWMTFLIILVAAVPIYNKWTKTDISAIEKIAANIDEEEAKSTAAISPFDIFLIMGVGFAVVAVSQKNRTYDRTIYTECTGKCMVILSCDSRFCISWYIYKNKKCKRTWIIRKWICSIYVNGELFIG